MENSTNTSPYQASVCTSLHKHVIVIPNPCLSHRHNNFHTTLKGLRHGEKTRTHTHTHTDTQTHKHRHIHTHRDSHTNTHTHTLSGVMRGWKLFPQNTELPSVYQGHTLGIMFDFPSQSGASDLEDALYYLYSGVCMCVYMSVCVCECV